MIAAKLAVTGGLVWYLLREVDLDESGEHLAGFDAGLGIVALLVVALLFLIAALRWRIYARALNISLNVGTAFRLYLIGQFFGQILPAGVGGDAVRVWLLARRGVAVGPGASSVVLERLTGLIGIVILIAVLLPLTFSYVGDSGMRLYLVLILAIAAAGISAIIGLSFVPRLITRWRAVAVISKLADVASEARHTGLMLKPALSVLLLSVFMHLLAVLTVYILALGLGMEITPLACLALVPVVLLLSTLPISVAGWGVRETVMVSALGFAGAESSEAFALSILFGLALLALSLVGAVMWLVQGRANARRPIGDKKGSEAAL
ncbi:MAG: lysylphosphatidylglycerol synthase transmembrane domain-containing protein [Alphaproteobacteria bacterium]|nr:lysylphosphatidylglycerol synthase transmembrane domain-containing protein [Alphaproteobacteria bacterium]MDP6589257.1 lysylphosphatidylglycerol synthase transmembrane domain-containing protein [Alphaproteobacteria bacterium]MDP6816658.1 lysylphosphatidylglycerol synthase transmembrane domain-containing protein [Alphaproteobacteria bacterium]